GRGVRAFRPAARVGQGQRPAGQGGPGPGRPGAAADGRPGGHAVSAARRSGRATDPRDIRTAHVLKDGVPAAALTRVEGGVEFAYTTAYLESGGRAVATTLPLTDAPVRTMAGAVPPYFA